ncbi:MAG TPA: hypothetical protein VHB21_18240 [Minicystis sp.]|nr:hypothetical protein [Minicystis sp.]
MATDSGEEDAAPPREGAPEEPPSDGGRALARPSRVAVVIYALVTAVMLVTAGPGRLARHTDYDHYALLAEAWLHGRLDLGGPPPAYTHDNDFAAFDGKTFVSFPPFPAVLILPAVALSGSAEKTRDALFFGLFTGVAPAFLYLALDKLTRARRVRTTDRENVALAALFAFGPVAWFSAAQGTVWFAAHVVGAGLLAAHLYFAIEAEHPVVAGALLALGFATRPSLGFAFPFFLFELWRARGRGSAAARGLVAFGAPCVAVLGLLLWHNAARFGDAFEFGHKLLTVAWRARMQKWGLFSYHYLGRNLAVCLAELPYLGVRGAPFQINGHGLALWVTSPFYAWALWPRRASPLFCALAVSAALVALPSLLYQNSGWIQFGYRFSNDFAPLLILMIAAGRRRLGAAFWGLAGVAVAVNAFGAITFQRAGFERYYFVDPTQRVLFQPD